MNIIIFNWRDTKNPKSGGAEIVTLEHAKAWVKQGYKVTWFSSEFPNSKKKEEVDGVKIIRQGNFITVYFLAPLFYLFSGNKFDLVIDEVHGLPFFTPFYVRKPIIVLIHEVAGKIWDYMFPFPINLIGRFTELFYFEFYKSNKFWVPSNSTVQDLGHFGIKKNECVVIDCAIKNEPLKKIPNDKERDSTFLFVSRVVKMKGVEDVIKSFANILREVSNAKLWIVGYGDERYINYLKSIIKSYNVEKNVTFWGKVSEDKKLELMRKAHLLLHASVKEGWGLVVVEAASQGTPSVVYNVSGLRDSVLNDKTGVVINRNVPEEMAKESVNLIRDKKRYQKYQEGGLKWAGDFTWDRSVAESINLITKVMNEKN